MGEIHSAVICYNVIRSVATIVTANPIFRKMMTYPIYLHCQAHTQWPRSLECDCINAIAADTHTIYALRSMAVGAFHSEWYLHLSSGTDPKVQSTATNDTNHEILIYTIYLDGVVCLLVRTCASWLHPFILLCCRSLNRISEKQLYATYCYVNRVPCAMCILQCTRS